MNELLELIKAAKDGDKRAKDKIVRDNTSLVWSVVQRIYSSEYEKEDLFQIGCMGLLKALDRYDTNYGAKFSTYAYVMILGEIKAFLRDNGVIKVSRSDKELMIKVQKAWNEYTNKYDRDPKVSELAEVLQVSQEEVISALEMKVNSKVKYLYEPIGGSDDKDMELIDKLEDGRDEENKADTKLMLQEELAELDEDEREVVLLRYYKDKKQNEVAILMGKTQVQISRLEKKAIEKMRRDFV